VSKIILQPELLEENRFGRPKESTQNRTPVPKILQGPSANDVEDRTRQIGDGSVYKYYLASIGWKLELIVAGLIVLYVLALKFPRMFPMR
jgi:ATP-binding cassette, subfamily C (CFTR/MRP), member 1